MASPVPAAKVTRIVFIALLLDLLGELSSPSPDSRSCQTKPSPYPYLSFRD